MMLLLALSTCAGVAGEKRLSDAEYYNKVRGAWVGKCIGGALGMPLESWRYQDIEKKYPKITGYVGYFDEQWTGWSGMVKSAEIPKDGEWHRMRVAVEVPKYDTGRSRAVLIIGMSLEFSTTPGVWEIRDMRVLRPKGDIAFDNQSWEPQNSCWWADDGTAHFDFKGERSWIKMRPSDARQLALEPGDIMLLSFGAKWTSGDNRIGFAFDYRSKEPRKGFGPDDDTSYQIVGLHCLETYGPDLSCKQIGKEWCDHLPEISNGLAEGLALERMRKGITPPESGVHPIGEAIGGQMKGEIWGLVCPGRPDLAAEYARRDGIVAHCKNGVYGEQFIAAMMSAAFYEKDPRKLVETGLNYVPQDSKYAEVVRETIAWHDKYPDWRDTRREIVAKYPGICNPVYAEAGIVVLALLYGEGDFEKTTTIAASCGNDTDCNTASVGALMGCIHGAKAIPEKWKGPVGDEFRCFVKGFENWKISELSHRICAQGRKVQAYHGDGMKFTGGV